MPVCADESVHELPSLAALIGKYDAINIKLDKTGGLTEALEMAQQAERLGFTVMVGCMVATSLAMAPAMLVAQRARIVDLDGPLLLARDRPDGLRYEGSRVYPPTSALMGLTAFANAIADAKIGTGKNPSFIDRGCAETGRHCQISLAKTNR